MAGRCRLQKDIPKITPLSPESALSNFLSECRMALPGIQALFGFQLIAVFEPPFFTLLSGAEQRAFLAALGLIALAIGLVLAPAPYHRLTESHAVSQHFLRIASGFLSGGIAFLMIAIDIDLYIVARLILNSVPGAVVFAILIGLFFTGLWFAFPYYRHRHDVRAGLSAREQGGLGEK